MFAGDLPGLAAVLGLDSESKMQEMELLVSISRFLH